MTIYDPQVLSERTIQNFQPTRLAIKELAGKLYFCKSTRQDFISYVGSGIYWLSRIKKYGKRNVKTLWVSDWYFCPYEIQEVALGFSKENQIVESDKWANMWPENGLNGGKTRNISANKGKMIGVDKSGKTLLIDIDSPLVLSGEVVSVNKDTVGVVKIESGETMRISQSEYRSNTDKYKSYTSGKMAVRDSEGNTLIADVNDPRVISGELSHVLKGTMTVKDSAGLTMKVNIDDPRVISGELKPLQTKMVNVVDQNGNSFSISTDDQRYISGEFKFSGGPKKGYKQNIVTCPYCGKSGGESNMSRHHFDKCKFKSTTHHEA